MRSPNVLLFYLLFSLKYNFSLKLYFYVLRFINNLKIYEMYRCTIEFIKSLWNHIIQNFGWNLVIIQNLQYSTAQFENCFELDIQFLFENYFNRRSISFACYAFCYKEEREILRRSTLSLFSPYKKHRYMSRNLLEQVNFLFWILH